MAKDNTVTAVLIKNPSVKRSFTYASAKSNGIISGVSKKWRLEQAGEITEVKKKEEGAGLARESKRHESTDSPSITVDEVKLPEDINNEEFAWVTLPKETPEKTDEQQASASEEKQKTPTQFLQDEYANLAGKQPDARWGEKRLQQEILKLKTAGNETI